jgi:DNA helicase-2/ATP-dependent DNA helicase PcrA
MSPHHKQLQIFNAPERTRSTTKTLPPVSPDIIARITDPLDLNPQQLTVVTATPGPILVIAGAGSGKTKVLTRRAGWLIAQGIHPKHIVLITFTRKAASEMLRRVQELNPFPTLKIQGGTFHSMAHTWLRQHGHILGLSNRFTLMDESDSSHLLQLLTSKQRLTKLKGFPDKRTLISIFTQASNSLLPIETVLQRDFTQYTAFTDSILTLHRQFAETKLTQQRFDYDDLLLLLYQIFTHHPETGQHIASQYQAVLVDEYQDTTKLQAQLVRCLSQSHGNVMVVGDPHQSIYSFRAADIRNMQEFLGLFDRPTVFNLSQNYRSTQNILRIANQLIPATPHIPKPALFSNNAPGRQPVLVQCPDEPTQSSYIIKQILAIQKHGLSLHRIAILVRLSAHSYHLEAELAHHHLPFVKYGGLALVETAHVKDFLSYLTVVQRPHNRHAWQRLLLLIDQMGPAATEKIISAMSHHPHPLQVLEYSPGPSMVERGRLAQLLRDLSDTNISLQQRLNQILDHYLPILKRHYPDDSHDRAGEITYLLQSQTDAESIPEIIERLTLTGASDHSQETEHPTDTLVISTIHSAKGLEWDAVFVINLMDGRLPHARAAYNPETLEEERRLLYVATTRARHLLYLTCPVQAPNSHHRGTGGYEGRCCRFLDALGPEDIDRITIQ